MTTVLTFLGGVVVGAAGAVAWVWLSLAWNTRCTRR